MDILFILIFVLIALFAISFFYLMIFLPRNQQKSLKIQLDSFINQQKVNNQTEEKKEEIAKFTLELKEKIIEVSEKLKTNEEITKILLENVDKSIKGEIVNQQNLLQGKNKELSERMNKESKELSERMNKDLELRLNNNQQLIKTYLEKLEKDFSQPLEKLNSVLLSNKRGEWGNTQLEELLSSYLPRDDKLFKREVWLKKKRTNKKEEGLRADAVVFSADNRHNIAIDSKFPLDNYLSSINDEWSKEQQKEFEKKFEIDVKKHIDKVSEYISPEEDGINYAIMFIPSEVIFSKINEQRYYSIIKTASAKRVSICSPTLLLVIIDQIKSWNKNWEQSKNLNKIISEIAKFWNDLRRFQERWDKIVKSIESNNENIRQFNISVKKIVETGEKIRDRESTLLKVLPTDLSEE